MCFFAGTSKQAESCAKGNYRRLLRKSLLSPYALPDGKSLVAEANGQDIETYTPGSLTLGKTMHGHQARVICVALTNDGKTLASLSSDNTIRLWNTSDAKETAKLLPRR